MNPAPRAASNQPVRGITFAVISLASFAWQDVIVKWLTQTWAVMQVLTFRLLLVLVLVSVLSLATRGFGIFDARQPWKLLLRGMLAFAAFSTYYVALMHMPLADAATILMSAPLFATALSVPLLGERVGLHRWIAIVLGFIAITVMLQPGTTVFHSISLLPVFSAVCYASIPVLTRSLQQPADALQITWFSVLSYTLCCVLASALLLSLPAHSQFPGSDILLAAWVPMSWTAMALVLLSSVLFTIGILCMTAAYRSAPVSTVAPFEYSYLLWAIVAGVIVFGDIPTSLTLTVGMAITLCGLYIVIREKQLRQRGKSVPAALAEGDV